MRSSSSQEMIHFSVAGDGPVVILLHGIAASGYGWSLLSTALIRNGFQVYIPDLPGHGESQKPEKPEHYHVKRIFNTLENWIESLGLPGKFILVGHSLGGHLCLQYSLDHPGQINGLVLINPFYSPQQLYPFVRWLQRRAAIGSYLLRRTPVPMIRRANALNPELKSQMSYNHRRQLVWDLHRASPMILHILPTVPDLTPVLANIKTPTQVIWGSRDRTLIAASFPKLVARLPNAIGCKVVGGSHQPHLTQADIVTPLVLDFVNRL